MAARQRMTQRALVERLTSPGNDDSGNPLPGTWATHVAAMPCKLYGTAEREAITEERTALVTDLRLLAPLSASVTTDERINGIVDRLGAAVLSGIARIEAVMHKGDHLELSLTRVTS